MKKIVIFLSLFLIVTVSFSQQSTYDNGRLAFKNYKYDEALEKFSKASNYFLSQNDIKNYLLAVLY